MPVTPPTPPAPAAYSTVATAAPGVQESRFREINRDSALFGRLPIGQRIRVNSQGQFSPEASPDDESSNPLGTPGPNVTGSSSDEPLHKAESQRSPRLIPLPPSPEDTAEALPQFLPGPGRHPEVHAPAIAAAMESETPSHDSSPLGQHYHDIRAYRSLFKSLNGEIEVEQQRSWSRAAKGEGVLGWVIVGRGARWLPGAQRVDGASREDILWENVGKSRGTRLFWAKFAGVAITVAAISECRVTRVIASAEVSGAFHRADRCHCSRVCALLGLPPATCGVGRLRIGRGGGPDSSHRSNVDHGWRCVCYQSYVHFREVSWSHS